MHTIPATGVHQTSQIVSPHLVVSCDELSTRPGHRRAASIIADLL